MEYFLIIYSLLTILAIGSWSVALSGTVKRHLHVLQLEDYEAGRMLRILIRNPRRLQLGGSEPIVLLVAISVACLLIILDLSLLSAILTFLTISFWGLSSLRRGGKTTKELSLAKKPLVMTTRARRIFIVTLCLSFTALAFPIAYQINLYLPLFKFPQSFALLAFAEVHDPVLIFRYSSPFWPLISMYFVERFSPATVAVATMLLRPVESKIQSNYLNDARRIISEMRPMVIGITGSYGKTSTKEFLSALLETKYNLLRPPGSYNTLMGVTRLIREQLRPYHEALVVEMGAYRIGSIAKLCELVSPTHGIVTIIGVQHLERFRSQSNIQKAKSELIQALPSDGIAVLNGDDPRCREIGDKHLGETLYFFSEPEESTGDSDSQDIGKQSALSISNLNIGIEGSDFRINYPDRETQDIHLSLLGRSAVVNTAAAVAMADRLEVSRSDIAATLASLPHVRHRLEPIHHTNGVTVIDDAYNSNPIGARYALEVLSAAVSGRRILVTPGMVELGSIEQEANFEFGRQAASCCDLAVLIGIKRSQPVTDGLIEGGFDRNNIWVVASLNDGLEKLKSWLKPGDTMLLENDLPDQYDE